MNQPSRDGSVSRRAWLVWVLGASCFGYAFFQRVSPSAMVSDLMRDFSVGAAVLGNLSAIYFYAYAGLQIPVGVAVDRWGPRRMLAVSVALAGIGSVLISMAGGISAASFGRLLVGIGSSVGFVGTLKLVGNWFPPHRFAFVAGLTMLVAMSFGVLGQAPLALVVAQVGWRPAMLAAGVYGIALAMLVWLMVRDRPEGVAAPSVGDGAGQGVVAGFGQALRRPSSWILALYAAAVSGPMLAYAGLWAVPHIMERYGVERPLAAGSASVMLIGWAVGSPLGGWLSDRLGRRKLPIVVGAVLTLAGWLVVLYAALPLQALWVALFLVGAFSSSMVISYAVAREVAPPGAAGALTGFVNMCTVGAGALMQPVIGWILDLNWQGAMRDGVRYYDLATYDAALVVIPLSGVIAVLAGLATRETHCRVSPQ